VTGAEVPIPVALLVDSITQGDVDGLVAVFTPDGFIDDVGGPWAPSASTGQCVTLLILRARRGLEPVPHTITWPRDGCCRRIS